MLPWHIAHNLQQTFFHIHYFAYIVPLDKARIRNVPCQNGTAQKFASCMDPSILGK